MPEPNTGCWLWIGSDDAEGYGRLNIDNVPMLAHRIAWTLYVGPIPDDLDVLHICDTPPCVNFEHLWLGDHAANMADREWKGRTARGEQLPHARLTPDAVRAIRDSTDLQHVIAARYGISAPHVSEIRARKCWTHVT